MSIGEGLSLVSADRSAVRFRFQDGGSVLRLLQSVSRDADPETILFPLFASQVLEELMFQRQLAGVMQRSLEDSEPQGAPPITNKDWNNLPVVTVSEEMVNSSSSEHDSCAVCMNTFELGESAMELPCSHLFCPDCLQKWLHRHRTCPLCRSEVKDVKHTKHSHKQCVYPQVTGHTCTLSKNETDEMIALVNCTHAFHRACLKVDDFKFVQRGKAIEVTCPLCCEPSTISIRRDSPPPPAFVPPTANFYNSLISGNYDFEEEEEQEEEEEEEDEGEEVGEEDDCEEEQATSSEESQSAAGGDTAVPTDSHQPSTTNGYNSVAAQQYVRLVQMYHQQQAQQHQQRLQFDRPPSNVNIYTPPSLPYGHVSPITDYPVSNPNNRHNWLRMGIPEDSVAHVQDDDDDDLYNSQSEDSGDGDAETDDVHRTASPVHSRRPHRHHHQRRGEGYNVRLNGAVGRAPPTHNSIPSLLQYARERLNNHNTNSSTTNSRNSGNRSPRNSNSVNTNNNTNNTFFNLSSSHPPPHRPLSSHLPSNSSNSLAASSSSTMLHPSRSTSSSGSTRHQQHIMEDTPNSNRGNPPPAPASHPPPATTEESAPHSPHSPHSPPSLRAPRNHNHTMLVHAARQSADVPEERPYHSGRSPRSIIWHSQLLTNNNPTDNGNVTPTASPPTVSRPSPANLRDSRMFSPASAPSTPGQPRILPQLNRHRASNNIHQQHVRITPPTR